MWSSLKINLLSVYIGNRNAGYSLHCINAVFYIHYTEIIILVLILVFHCTLTILKLKINFLKYMNVAVIKSIKIVLIFANFRFMFTCCTRCQL